MSWQAKAAHAAHFASFFSSGANASRSQAYQQLGLVGRQLTGSSGNGGANGSSRYFGTTGDWLSPDRANSTASGDGPTNTTADDDDGQRRFSSQIATRASLRRSSSFSRAGPQATRVIAAPTVSKVALQVRYRSAIARVSHANTTSFSKLPSTSPSPSPAGPTRPRRHSTSSLEGTLDSAPLPIYMVRRSSQHSARPLARTVQPEEAEVKRRLNELVTSGNYDELVIYVRSYVQSGRTSATCHNIAIASLDALRPDDADPVAMLDVFRSYNSHNIRPSVHALARVVWALCRYDSAVRGSPRDDLPYVKAIGLYDLRRYLVNDDLPTIVVDALVKASAERGDVEAATNVFRAMQSPTAHTYHSLLSLHRSRGHVEDARLTMSMLANAQADRTVQGLEDMVKGTVLEKITVEEACWSQFISTFFVAGDPASAIAAYERLESKELSDDLPRPVAASAETLGQIVLGFVSIGDISSAATWLERISIERSELIQPIADAFARQIASSPALVDDRIAALERVVQLEGISSAIEATLNHQRLLAAMNIDTAAIRALSDAGHLDQAATALEAAAAKFDHARRTHAGDQAQNDRFGEAIRDELEYALVKSSADFNTAIKLAQASSRAGHRPKGLAALALATAYLTAVAEETADLSPEQWASIVDAFAIAKPTFLGPVVERAAQNNVALARDSQMAAWTAETLPQAIQSSDEVDRLSNLLSGLSPSSDSSASLSITPPSPAFMQSPMLTPTSSVYTPSIQHDPQLDKEIASVHVPHSTSLLLRVARVAERGQSADPHAIAELIRKLSQADAQIERIHQAYLLGYHALGLPKYAGERQTEAWLALENEMLKAMANAHQLDKVAMHRDRILEAGFAPTADAIGSMIVHARDTTDDASVALEIFADARAMGVVPNVFLYNTVISRLSRARRSADALALFEEMKGSGLQPTSVTYGAIINATGDEVSACALFEEMINAPGYRPNVPPFNTLMQLFQGRGDRARALHYYDRMLRARVKPTDHTWRLLLDIYGSIQPVDAKSTLDVFERIRRDPDVPLSGLHWASLISMYGIALHDVDRAISIFESIARDPSSRRADPPLPDAVSYEALFNTLALAGRHDIIQSYRQRMQREGVPLTAYIANTLIESFAARGAIDEARALFESLQDPAAGVAAPTHRQIKSQKRRQGNMGSTKVSGNDWVYREPSTYEALIKAELAVGDRARAQALVERANARAFPVAVLASLRSLL